MAKLPAIPPPNESNVVQVLEALRERALVQSGELPNVSASEANATRAYVDERAGQAPDGGVSEEDVERTIQTSGDVSDLMAPTGVMATGTINGIVLRWDSSPYATEVRRGSGGDDYAAAVSLGQVTGSIYFDDTAADNVTYRYWLLHTHVNSDGTRVYSSPEPGATEDGVEATKASAATFDQDDIDLGALSNALLQREDVSTLSAPEDVELVGTPFGYVVSWRYTGYPARIYRQRGGATAEIGNAVDMGVHLGAVFAEAYVRDAAFRTTGAGNQVYVWVRFEHENSDGTVISSAFTQATRDGGVENVRVGTNDLGLGLIYDYHITDGAVNVFKLAENSVTAEKLVNDAVTEAKLAADAVTADALKDGAVTTDALADDAVEGDKLRDGIVESSHLAALAVTAGKIAANAVTAGKIAANAVTSSKLSAGSVTAGKIAAHTVTAAELAAGSVTTGKIAAEAVTAATIAAEAVIAGKIAANAVTANEIAANAVIAGKIAANAVTADQIAANAITAGKIAAAAVTTNKLAAGAVTTGKLAAGSITSGTLAANAVIAGKIAAGAITAGAGVFEEGAILAADIGDAQIQSAKIADTLESQNYVADTAGWQIRRSGRIEINDLVARGSMESANYEAGSAGWKVGRDGSAELDGAAIRGTVSAAHIDSTVFNHIPLWKGNNVIDFGTDLSNFTFGFGVQSGDTPQAVQDNISAYLISGAIGNTERAFGAAVIPKEAIYRVSADHTAKIRVSSGDSYTENTNGVFIASNAHAGYFLVVLGWPMTGNLQGLKMFQAGDGQIHGDDDDPRGVVTGVWGVTFP